MRSKKPRVWNKTAKIRSALRQVFRWSPLPIAAKNKARIGRGSYLCANCNRVFGPKEIQVDHIEPVTPIGWESHNWTEYVHRLFNGELQVLCVECHKERTKEQMELRKRDRRLARKVMTSSSDH